MENKVVVTIVSLVLIIILVVLIGILVSGGHGSISSEEYIFMNNTIHNMNQTMHTIGY